MLRASLSRYQLVRMSAVALGAVALLWDSVVMFWAVTVALVVLITLGVKIPQMRFFGPFVCRGRRSRRCVALTFDDGPDARSTPALLELLREAGVEAAFFCVGQRVATHPALAARIVREGHLLENHSYSHKYTTNLFTAARLRSELSQTQSVIRETTGTAPRWFRPPMGLTNPRVFRAARAMGLTVVGWTARGLDTKLREPELIVARIVKGLEPGAIILLHDGGIPADRLVRTVKALLNSLRALQYEVVRLDQMLERV